MSTFVNKGLHPSQGLLVKADALAIFLEELDQAGEALAILRKSFSAQEPLTGEEGPYTYLLMYNLAALLHAEDELEEAERMLRVVVDGQRRTLGGLHRDTLRSMASLATLLMDQSRLVLMGF